MTLQPFSEVFALLAVQLRFTDADEATIRGYFLALSDVPLEFIAMAAQRFAQGASINSQGEAWFPKAPEWRALAAKVEVERGEALRAVLRQRAKHAAPLCLGCDDTTWARDASGRVRRCDCLKLRRLEVLGVRPMPAGIDAESATEPGAGPLTQAASLALMDDLRARGLTPRIRVLRESLRSRLARREDRAQSGADATDAAAMTTNSPDGSRGELER